MASPRNDDTGPDAPDPLLRVLRGLIRPLVRTLIARGITAPAFYRLLKQVYVEVAAEDFRLDDTPPTDSRITLLTGVHRQDVKAIREGAAEPWEAARGKAAAFATVLGQWLARPGFVDDEGRPLPLPRSGEGASFEALVRSVSTDIRPRTVLDELLRQGLVTESADGTVALTGEAVLGPGGGGDDATKVAFFATNVGDHLAAAAENLLSESPPFLERAVFYNRLSGASVDRIEARARGLSQSVLEELNRESAALQQADRESDAGAEAATERYRFGVYFYREPSQKPVSAAATQTDKGVEGRD